MDATPGLWGAVNLAGTGVVGVILWYKVQRLEEDFRWLRGLVVELLKARAAPGAPTGGEPHGQG